MQNQVAAELSIAKSHATERVRAERAAPCALEPCALPIDSASGTFVDVLEQWRAIARGASALLAPELSLLTAELVRECAPLLVGARQNGRLVAALPLARQGRTLRALRSDHTPRVDMVGNPTALPQLWRAMVELEGWDMLELRGIPDDSPLALQLPALARDDGCIPLVREIGRAPWFEVQGIEQRIHRRFRGDMRRLERQLGGVELERFARFDADALRDVLRLEASGWKAEMRTDIASDPRIAAFYSSLAQDFARRGQLTMAFLRARGERIAACLALEDDSTFYLVKIGYDPAYAHFGPGQLLVRETALDAARRGLTRYDLLGKDTPYKMKWTEKVRPHVELLVYAPSLRGRARHWACEVARPLAGRALRALRG